ncbi:2,3-dihydroxybenzoate-2,3-dehydrogenase domain protein [Oesophagostomum dentatum]|uniref:2,3-dihydroxybenzoate-2,3-dehydrogenase domain protein n=1 Tax=Oesophagostomum dentatum TaxID=61180 RepID=A0A0B1T4R2_OESDE|nr:2,3-dihydroxybenzoate-2,3-dehydrogenase domain protein [Oesophagostomum dentatum]
MMRAVAIDLIGEGVRVNSVSPGAVITDFMQNMGMPAEIFEKQMGSFTKIPGALPCGKVAVPSDIASIIAFLADRSQSWYIVGQIIVADGGTSIVLALNATPNMVKQLE